MKSAFTLLETLLALVLLTGLVAAAASWTQISAHASTELTNRAQRQGDLEAFFAFVHDAIRTGDFDTKRDAEDPRVQIRDRALLIRSRSLCSQAGDTPVGELTYRVEHDPITQRLEVVEVRQGRQLRRRVLLTTVHAWSCDIDEEREALTVLINDDSVGDGTTRRFLLP